ncbi:MAG TPA: histidine phosphatase family protein [Ktedonosporobacter sp.]|nr:histidine phosphatase family protein [Ktedonosporobacter sp.]
MQTIWFIRHGESEGNAGGRSRDPAGIPLTSAGEEQARQVALAFPEAPSLIVTSPYLRAKQTALATMQRFPGVCHEEWPVQEFTYLAPDQLGNTTSEERRPLVEEYWRRRDPWYVDGEGAESFASFMGRVYAALERVKGCQDCFIAIFSHEQFIHGVLWSLIRDMDAHELTDIGKFKHFHKAFNMPNGAILKTQFCGDETAWFSGFVSGHLS